MDDDMTGMQLPPPGIEDLQDDDLLGDGGEEPQANGYANDEDADVDHEYQNDHDMSQSREFQDRDDVPQDHEYRDDDEEDLMQEDHNGEEELAAMELQQYHDDQDYHEENIIDSIEDGHHTQVQHHEEFEPHPVHATPMQDASGLSRGHPENAHFGSDFRPAHFQDEHYDNDSSSLFVSERETVPPTTASTPGPATNMPPPAPHQKLSSASIFANIRKLQKNAQEKKITASRKTPAYPGNVNLDIEEYLAAVSPTQPRPTRAPGISRGGPTADEEEQAEEEAHKKAILEFKQQKRYYDDLKKKQGGRLNFRQEVELMKIKGIEDARRKKRERDLARAQEDMEGEPGLFPEVFPAATNEEEGESDDAFDFDTASSRKRRHREMPRKAPKQTSMQDAELQSMRVALEADGDAPRKKKKGEPNDGESQASAVSSRGRGSKAKSTGRAPRKAAPKKATKGGAGRGSAKNKKQAADAIRQAASLFNADVFQQQAGENATEQPTFRSRNKADALKELIASVPLEDQKKAKGDMNILLAATKDFDGKGAVRSDGHGFWIVKGMRTSLKGYQVLGTAFMRRRENAADEPKGGLMADQMGLGKTLMMLANIVNGQPPKGAKGPKTTLLVASPALLTQWKNEIEQHTNKNLKIMRYGAGTRVDSTNAPEILQGHDIILTTYSEIMKSYPKNEPPIECQTAEQKIQWWKEVYETQRGVLHRMMFLRVVLDEAQAIKNHMARTSIACRALMAHHKWALSGTPILNSLTELYPYFKFLNVPHTGSFKIFKHNYCDSGDTENTERLLLRLSQFMIRRTHADEMFGAPILKLPQADQSTYWCEFNSVERCIYDIVRQRFAKNINMWQAKGELEKSYSNALVMLLRLRQLTAHVLMLQFVMQDLLEREDIERIKEVVKVQAAESNTRRGKTILGVRRQLEKLAEDERKKRATRDAKKAAAKAKGPDFREDSDDSLANEEQDDAVEESEVEDGDETQPGATRFTSGGDFGKLFNFKPFLSSLHDGESWEKAKKRAKCGYCGKQPWKPFITSCGHLICSEPCRSNWDLEAAENYKLYAPCRVCGITPSAVHPCEVEEGDDLDVVAQGTRSKSKKKKKEKQSKRLAREDINSDWLGSLGDDVLPSAKTIAVKSQIMNWFKENPRVKIIIYTQFLAMIKILARICQQEGWHTEQYHGKLSFAARDKAINNFADNPNSRIMLASLRCGGLGLNLTMASKVIMIDPWWNSASEQQAFCRVFRIGQKEETFMSRLCVHNTVDERLINMQERKQREIDAVMEDDGSKTKKMDIRDLMRLFGNLEEDADGKPFIMVDNPDPRGGFRADRDDEGYADEF